MFQKKKSDLSLAHRRIICGIEVRKMPLGAYLKAAALISQELPRLMLSVYGFSEDMEQKLGDGAVPRFFPGLIEHAPMVFVNLLAELVEVSPERLLEDANIGLDGILEIAEAFWEINSLGKCQQLLSKMISKALTELQPIEAGTNHGFSG